MRSTDIRLLLSSCLSGIGNVHADRSRQVQLFYAKEEEATIYRARYSSQFRPSNFIPYIPARKMVRWGAEVGLIEVGSAQCHHNTPTNELRV